MWFFQHGGYKMLRNQSVKNEILFGWGWSKEYGR
jgi:hypothetical protein